MRRLIAAAWLAALLQGCVTCRFDWDAGREVAIVAVAPEEQGRSGLRQRFGVRINDSFDAPHELHVSVALGAEETLWCELDEGGVADHETDRQYRDVREANFWCPVDATALAAGKHRFTYRVYNRDGKVAAVQSVQFDHDPEPPLVNVTYESLAGGARITWASVSDDVRELTFHVGAVRVTTSNEPSGELVLDASLLPAGREVRVRAFDTAGNVTEEELRR